MDAKASVGGGLRGSRPDARGYLGEPRVFISRAALLHNARLLRKSLAPTVKLCAMVKADAYGHGAALVADALSHLSCGSIEAPAADSLAVATFDEAGALGATSLPVLIMRPIENIFMGRRRNRLEHAIRKGWTLTVCTASAASDVARVAVGLGRRVAVQAMVDTGMGREGAPPGSADALFDAIHAQPSLKLMGLCTHFAQAEVPDDAFTAEQLAHFEQATRMVAWKHPRIVRHAANSAAAFFHPDSHLDMVRPGIALYGIDPTGRPSLDRPLRPALKWVAPLQMLRTLEPGQTVGYGQTWRADRATRVGLVPIGYADGYLRSFSNRAMMLLHGRPVPVIGQVSMDYVTLDLTAVPQAEVGDTVTVLDSDPLSPVSVYALARWAGTIPYEILCRIGARMHRVATDPTDEELDSCPTRDSTSAEESA